MQPLLLPEETNSPLAARMRPENLSEVVGQDHLLSPNAAFCRLLAGGNPVSMLLWGPPGTGKTTLARLIAGTISACFETLSATSSGVKELRTVLAQARQRLDTDRTTTLLFIDEIHRFSKNQQDALLPGTEDGTVILVGATTENPFFEVNSPLLSRLTLFRTEPLSADDLSKLVDRALSDPDRGLGGSGVGIDPAALTALVAWSGGDGRVVLNNLEIAFHLAVTADSQMIGMAEVEAALGKNRIRYDRSGDQHYDVISAFIKSVRGSDVDAALYWLFFMLEGGEDPEFISRRLLILAAEDIGLADPRGLEIASAAAHALSVVGLPEAAHHLAMTTIYLATAPKSNSVTQAMSAARSLVRQGSASTVPIHLRSSAYGGSHHLGHGRDYSYAHSYPDHVVDQQYFPDQITPTSLFYPGQLGYESELAARLEAIDRVFGRERNPDPPTPTSNSKKKGE